MKQKYYIYTILLLMIISIWTPLKAQDNAFILGGVPPQLRVNISSGGLYCVYRYTSTWEEQFYTPNTPVFSIKIDTVVYRSNSHFTIKDVSATTTGMQQEVTKIFSRNYNGNPFSVLFTIQYNLSNLDYIIQSATIDATQLPPQTVISFAYGFDAYVNGCDGGAAIVIPDLGYNNLPNPSTTLTYLTSGEVRKSRLIGGINTRGLGSLIGFFPIGRYFDRAISS
jgi:hypothetical protein